MPKSKKQEDAVTDENKKAKGKGRKGSSPVRVDSKKKGKDDKKAKEEKKNKKAEEQKKKDESKKAKEKIAKDPAAPKKTTNAYMVFTAENRAKVVKENPDMKGKHVSFQYNQLIFVSHSL